LKQLWRIRGYTLLELILVILIFSLVLSLAIPRLGGLIRSDELRASALRLVGLIKDTRNRAMMEQRYYRLYFEPNTSNVWTEKIETVREDVEKKKKSISRDVIVKGIWSGTKGKQSEGEVWITFSPMGYCDGALIYLLDDKSKSFTIQINPFGTQIDLIEGEVEPELQEVS